MLKNCYDREIPYLDLYPVHYKKEEIDLVLGKIKKFYTGKEPLVLYTNCWCDIRIDGIPVARQYDNLLYSKEADVALLVSRMLDPEEIMTMLDQHDLRLSKIVAGEPIDDGFIDNPNIPGFYPVREKEVLKEATDAALSEFVDEADVYVNSCWSLMVGYTVGENHYVLYRNGGFGLVDTGVNCSLIIKNGDPRNIHPCKLAAEVESLGLKANVKRSGHPSFVTADPSAIRRK